MRRTSLFTKVAGRLGAGTLGVAIVLCGLSSRVMAGGAPPPGVSSDQSVAQSTIIPPGPPTGFNALTASDEDLDYYGFPPKPDQQSDPNHYAIWKKMVSVPRGANPQVTQTDIYQGAARNVALGKTLSNGIVTGTSTNWSGYTDTAPEGTFTPNDSYVFSFWVVPFAQQPFGVCSGGYYYSSAWDGLDGFTSPDVLQAGTESDAYCSGSTKSQFYSAWYEWDPFNEVRVSSPAAQPGDLMSSEVWYTTASPHGHAYLVNYTLDASGTYAFNPPSGTSLRGDSAEWVVERPLVIGGLSDLTNYISDYFHEAQARSGTTGSVFYPGSAPTGDTIYNLTMTCPPWTPSSSCNTTTGLSTAVLYATWDLFFYVHNEGPAY
jgi:hypothetical protein